VNIIVGSHHLEEFANRSARVTEALCKPALPASDRLVQPLTDDVAEASRTIASIAADAGVTHLSFCNRVFRRRYSITPSDLRRMPPPPEALEPG